MTNDKDIIERLDADTEKLIFMGLIDVHVNTLEAIEEIKALRQQVKDKALKSLQRENEELRTELELSLNAEHLFVKLKDTKRDTDNLLKLAGFY